MDPDRLAWRGAWAMSELFGCEPTKKKGPREIRGPNAAGASIAFGSRLLIETCDSASIAHLRDRVLEHGDLCVKMLGQNL